MKDLLAEFNAIKTVKQKLIFWDTKLKTPYITYLRKKKTDNSLKDFEIHPESKPDRAALNNYILSNYGAGDSKQIVLEIKKLKAELNERLKTVQNKYKALGEEEKRIDESFVKGKYFSSNVVLNLDFNANYETYQARLNYNIEPDLSQIVPDLSIVQKVNGNILAEYKLHVAALRKKASGNNKQNKPGELTLNQFTLLFELYGIWDNLNCSASEKANLFEDLIPASESYKRMYDSIRTAGAKKRKNREDLEALYVYAKIKKLKSLQETVETELKKLR